MEAGDPKKQVGAKWRRFLNVHPLAFGCDPKEKVWPFLCQGKILQSMEKGWDKRKGDGSDF